MTMTESLVAKRFALRIQPVPSIVLEYVESGKSRVRTIKLMDLSSDSDVDKLAAKVLASLPRRLDRTKVRSQVKDMVTELLALHKEACIAGTVEEGTGPAEVDDEAAFLDADLNIVSPSRLSAAKEQMNVGFEANRKRPGEDGFVYDVRKDFTPSLESEWDD